MSDTAMNLTDPAGFVAPWDDATFDLMVEKFDPFQFAQVMKRRQDSLGGIWASEYLPGLFPGGGFWNAAAALSTRGVRYSSLEEAASWDAVKETWMTSGSSEDELKPFSYALAHVPLTPEQAMEFAEFLIKKNLVHGTMGRRFAHNPVFKDEDLYGTMLGLDSDAERALDYSRFKLSFISSRYAVPHLVRRTLPIVRTPRGNDDAARNLASKNPALAELHGKLVVRADDYYMDDASAKNPVNIVEILLSQVNHEFDALTKRTAAEVKEGSEFADVRTLTFLYLAASNAEVRSSLTPEQEVELSHNLGRLYLPLVMNSEDLMSRVLRNATVLLGLPHVARYAREELRDNGADVDGVPLNWLLELLG